MRGTRRPHPPERSDWGRVAEGAAPLGARVEVPIHQAAKSVHDTIARKGYQSHLARLTGLEPHRRAGGNVEPHAARLGAIEAQRRVGLEEMIMRADLDRSIARVVDAESRGGTAGIEFDLATAKEILARLHGDHRIGR